MSLNIATHIPFQSKRLEYPVFLMDEPSHVVLELPKGKVAKNGEITTQSAQKGRDYFFYAVKRILTTEQIRSPFGVECSRYRKALSSLDITSNCVYVALAHKTFLQSLGIDGAAITPQYVARRARALIKDPENITNSFGLATTSLTLDKVIKQVNDAVNITMAKTDGFSIREAILRSTAEIEIAKGHALATVFFHDISTPENLIQTIKIKGPIVIATAHGKSVYGRQNPFEVAKIGDRSIFGWNQQSATKELKQIISAAHMLVIVGAQIAGSSSYIYWIAPEEANTPETGQRIYVSSFGKITSKLSSIQLAAPLDEFTPKQQNRDLPIGFYNPLFAPQ